MSGILPYVEDTVPSKLKRGKYTEKSDHHDSPYQPPTTTSLSYDQVNDNADELIELRGEGRYFGVTDPSNPSQALGPICANCHKRGHLRAKCKTVICHKCGIVGDHYETHCPTTLICARCGEKGHIAINCSSKVKKRSYCRNCDTFTHGDENCPSIWRSYLTKRETDNDENNECSALPVIYCYNCGDNEHYGDECPKYRTSRIPNVGSAFSGSNLPRKFRPLYFSRLKSKSNIGTSSSRGGNDSYYRPESAVTDYQSDYSSGTRNYFSNNNNDYSNSFGQYELNNNYNNKMPSRSGYMPPATVKGNNSASMHKANSFNGRPITNFSLPTRSGTIRKIVSMDYGDNNNNNNNKPKQKQNHNNNNGGINKPKQKKQGKKSSRQDLNGPTRSGLITESGGNKKKPARFMRY
ncbi:uncharacterized protein J8A68_000340 [[Candida] subhashii]|uniref:CCHC-type domain-containing protein n=1 Tax=[Candida] subhashii TaxID=561895 RepID=A0A8J5QT36_9ASCO|nr:uncharacterized protein J8A68_000340 [[Candida] subhashii]KAG7666084.1 hypothetical protein J8A68_000340 [[Candida] subhashii]